MIARLAAVIDPQAFAAAHNAVHYGQRREQALAKAERCRDIVLDAYRDRLRPEIPEWREPTFEFSAGCNAVQAGAVGQSSGQAKGHEARAERGLRSDLGRGFRGTREGRGCEGSSGQAGCLPPGHRQDHPEGSERHGRRGQGFDRGAEAGE